MTDSPATRVLRAPDDIRAGDWVFDGAGRLPSLVQINHDDQAVPGDRRVLTPEDVFQLRPGATLIRVRDKRVGHIVRDHRPETADDYRPDPFLLLKGDDLPRHHWSRPSLSNLRTAIVEGAMYAFVEQA